MGQKRQDAQDTELDRGARADGTDRGTGRATGDAGHEAEQTGHQANVNQVREEPMPASHHEDPRQEAVERNEEHSQAGEQGR